MRRSAPPAAAFVDITRQAGITFEHENGAAGQKLLPETMGGGVAFLDFDNDGRPDLLFVDSRPWPSAAPGARPCRPFAARAVSQPGRRTLRGRHRRLRVWPRTSTAWASPPPTTTTMAGPICSSPPSASTTCSTTSADTSPMSRRRPASAGGPTMEHVRHLVRLRSRRQPRPVRLQLRPLVEGDRPAAGLPAGRTRPRLWTAAHLRGDLPLPVPQRRPRPLHRRVRARGRADQEPGDRRADGQVARRGAGRSRRRRLARSRRRQRHGAELRVPQPQNGTFEEIGASAGHRVRPLRQQPQRDGHRRGRLPQRRLARHRDRQLRQRDDGALCLAAGGRCNSPTRRSWPASARRAAAP